MPEVTELIVHCGAESSDVLSAVVGSTSRQTIDWRHDWTVTQLFVACIHTALINTLPVCVFFGLITARGSDDSIGFSIVATFLSLLTRLLTNRYTQLDETARTIMYLDNF